VVAQPNIQLYNQLRRQGLTPDDLVLVRRSYELAAALYSGYYQGDGKPFVAHGVGVASILADLGQPVEIVALGLIHAVYGNGDFGDGRDGGVTSSRRRRVREAVGPQLEELVHRFTERRLDPDSIAEIRRTLPELSDTDRRLQLVAVADHLEKYVDLGVLYFGDNEDIVSWTESIGDELVGIAEELGEARLARMVRAAFAEAAAEERNVPAQLRPPDGLRHLNLVVPASCRPRLSMRARWLNRRVRD